jgi:hypothetical protein
LMSNDGGPSPSALRCPETHGLMAWSHCEGATYYRVLTCERRFQAMRLAWNSSRPSGHRPCQTGLAA